MREKQELTKKENLVEFFFRNHASIFATAGILGLLVVVGANRFASVTLYQNLTLGIGWTQAVITGYLSFKIFEVSKRDSELPNLAYRIVNVEDAGSPHDNHKVIRCTVRFTNTSYGRAQITDIDLSTVFDEVRLKNRKPQGEGLIAKGFPEGKPVPTILDKGEKIDVMIQVHGFNYLTTLCLDIEEKSMGTQEFHPMVTDISDRLAMKRRSLSEKESGES